MARRAAPPTSRLLSQSGEDSPHSKTPQIPAACIVVGFNLLKYLARSTGSCRSAGFQTSPFYTITGRNSLLEENGFFQDEAVNNVESWAEDNFSDTGFPDERLDKRMVKIGEQMSRGAGKSLPKLFEGDSAALAATYRFLNNDAVTPAAIQAAHIREVVRKCTPQPVVLCVQDTTELDYSGRDVEGLGKIGNGRGQGLMQHSALAVIPDEGLVGLLHQNIHRRCESPRGETTRQRQSRPTETKVWSDVVRAVAKLELGDARIIHVCDRGGDRFELLHTCREFGHAHVIRAMYDRKASEEDQLWELLSKQAVVCSYDLEVPARKEKQAPRGYRNATLSVRFSSVHISAPVNIPHMRSVLPSRCGPCK
jgi:hypothetical protein